MFSDKKFDCDLCRLVQQDKGGITCEGLEKTENGVCPDGRIPSLDRCNYEIWNLFILMQPGLMRMEGYDYNAIGVVFDMYGIEQRRRPEMFETIVKLIKIMDGERRKKTNGQGQ